MAKPRIFFATNRNYLPDNKLAVFGGQFNPDGIGALRFGQAELDDQGKLVQPVFVYPDPKKKDADNPPPGTGSRAFLDDLRIAMRDGCTDTLIFIHGFNVSFVAALEAGGALASEITIGGKPINVVVFSWPSDGKMIPYMSYYSDREDARTCGAALARTYLKLYDFMVGLKPKDYCDQSLHLLAHSMGNYVLRNGLQALIAKDPTKLVRMFKEIVLAAPDEDDDAFDTDQKLRLLPGLCRRLTVYYNQNDRALLISDKTKGNPDRLGSDGPRMLDLLPKKVFVVDCGRVAGAGDPMIQHSYYIHCQPVSADLQATLGGVPPDSIVNRDVIRAERAYRIRN
ncbi:alpha/beta hydrolase [Sphingomonas sp. URHD0057]|uniref:alpha/beta hydrolase n=1 Tax=Sphingomonas sp. URHD0057 TaxID=1380389 RepID=UPI00048D0AF8|nr:alpha/beta hydrolase [Sphingomonas sp. URHD0057]